MFAEKLKIAKSAFPLHSATSKFVVCINAIERFYDKQGNEMEMVVMKAESNIPCVWI